MRVTPGRLAKSAWPSAIMNGSASAEGVDRELIAGWLHARSIARLEFGKYGDTRPKGLSSGDPGVSC